jgi:hypothetical protein
VAFGQHYALGRNGWTDSYSPWLRWEETVRQDFGTADTVAKAASANPAAFAAHVERNAALLLERFVGLFKPVLPLGDGASYAVRVGLGLVLVAGLILGVWRLRATSQPRGVILLMVSCAVLAPSFVSSLIIHPRPHYLLSPLGPLAAFAAWGYGGLPSFRAASVPRGLVAGVLCVAVLALLPGRGGADVAPWWLRAYRERSVHLQQPTTAAALLVERLARRAGTTVLEAADPGVAWYSAMARRIDPTDCRPSQACFAVRRPDAIVADASLVSTYDAAGDPGLRACLTTPERCGYYPVPLRVFVLLVANERVSELYR